MYMGRQVIRGILCDWWRSCMYWDILASNFTLDYFFTGTRTLVQLFKSCVNKLFVQQFFYKAPSIIVCTDAPLHIFSKCARHLIRTILVCTHARSMSHTIDINDVVFHSLSSIVNNSLQSFTIGSFQWTKFTCTLVYRSFSNIDNVILFFL